jgi:hypothetical protein
VAGNDVDLVTPLSEPAGVDTDDPNATAEIRSW